MSAAGLLAETDEVRAHLIGSAAAGEAISYSDLLERLGFGFSRPKMRALCKVLSVIDEEASARGEPELAVLVVRQSDGLPGQGWWVGCSDSRGYNGPWEGPEARRLVDTLQAEAFDYWRRNS
ncbi:ribose-phosphate pyrophosphokinase [Sphingomonas piscis]|uniref:ribose-phosphate pyrophosphokinase n=1 Tax=Sphingomonas piscis TaxID=2714943 RepID=UPI001FE8CC3F|nr:ribose-phosphate pyrophosphokinase [Sphingomonas piscis]